MTMTETRTAADAAERAAGRVVAIAGPVVDAEFPPGAIPEINTAVEMHVELEGQPVTITGEVAQQIGDSRVPAIVPMKATDGLTRGMTVVNTGQGITVPVGDGALGPHLQRARPAASTATEVTEGIDDRWEIHRPAPAFDTLEPQGYDVRDRHQGDRPAHPLRGGRQDRPVRRRRRGQDGAHHRDDQPCGHPARRRVGVRRGGRAHPRGHRPLSRDGRVGRARRRHARWSSARWTSRLASALRVGCRG